MIYPDIPIEKSSEDKLNRESFAKSLAHTLLNASFPASFSVGLYGAWGSGKTSLLNMIVENIEKEDSDVIVLRYNPWLCSDPKQLITQFFKQLATTIKLKKPAADAVYNLIDQYADIFDAANLFPGAGIAIAAAGKVFAKKAKKRINQKSNDLQAQKNEIIQKLKEDNLRIIVPIDDIDRLSKTEIIAVFQLVKALADFPNAIYLLAFDYDVVVNALGEVQHGDGREYLEKIIQVPFEIPTPSMESIHAALLSKLNEILGDIPEERWDKATWSELFHFGIKEYIKSIRDVIRYSNVFYLKYELLKDETDPIDLLGLTCLQVFEPTVYSLLTNYREDICGANNSYLFERRNGEDEKVKNAINGILSNGSLSNTGATQRILGILFPRIRSVVEVPVHMGRYYDYRKFMVNNNIAESKCFDRYFSLTLENNAIPTATIKNLIYEADESEVLNGISWIYQEGKITRLLEEIAAYANGGDSRRIPPERAKILIYCLCQKWESFEVKEEGFLTVPFNWWLLNCVDPLLKAIEEADRNLCIHRVFMDADVSPSTLALLLHDFEIQHGRFTDKDPHEDRQVITIDELLKLEKIFKDRAVDAINSGKALEQSGGLKFLWMLSQIDDNLVSNIKKNLIVDEVSLAKVISYCTSRGETISRIVIKTRQVNIQLLSEFIKKEDAHQRMKKFITTQEFLQLPEDTQMDAIAFLITVERGIENSLTENCISEEGIKKELEKVKENLSGF